MLRTVGSEKGTRGLGLITTGPSTPCPVTGMDEPARAWVKALSTGSDYIEVAGLILCHGSRLDDTWKVSGVVDVKMGQRMRSSDCKLSPSSPIRVNAPEPASITKRGLPLIKIRLQEAARPVGTGSASTEKNHFHFWAGLRRRKRWQQKD